MPRNNLRTLVPLVGVVLFANLAAGRLAIAQESGSLVMVVGKSIPEAAVSKSDAKRMLLGQTTTWPNGSKVIVVLKPAGSKERATLLQVVCGMSEAEFTRYEMQVAFTGRSGTVMHDAGSPAAIKNFLKANPGAIGFLHPSEVDGDVKAVLKIE
jgi:ABC-type phosphate transport system substrate-binding protein